MASSLAESMYYLKDFQYNISKNADIYSPRLGRTTYEANKPPKMVYLFMNFVKIKLPPIGLSISR
jgi:hypothetical protein